MPLTAIDLFAGAGGATQGLRDAGFEVRAAVEWDSAAATTWAVNHPGVMIQGDVRKVSTQTILDAAGLVKGELDLLKACPPCQGFSSLRGARTPDDDRNDLVLDLLRLVSDLMPKVLLIENVPGLRNDWRFDLLTKKLSKLGYFSEAYVARAEEFGVPQRRRRLILVAMLGSAPPRTLDEFCPHESRMPRMTAGAALATLANEQIDPAVLRHRRSSALVMERIKAVPPEGGRFDLPQKLQLDCHQRLDAANSGRSRSASASYGRIILDKPAPTMTTRCTTPACGRFIHPTLDRGITLAEAAAFQTFPTSYRWIGNYGEIERQIGNAVPCRLAYSLGLAIAQRLRVESEVFSPGLTV